MKIYTKRTKLGKILSSYRQIQRYFGKNRAKNIAMRLDEFSSAEDLSEIPYTPPTRCHQLNPKNKCKFAVDISPNYRIVFQGYTQDEHLTDRKGQITKIEILKIEDYH